jgi:hypothetical protein
LENLIAWEGKVATNIRERIKRKTKALDEVLKERKVIYLAVFAVPFVGVVASAFWIAWDYFRHKKNGGRKEPI